MGKDIFTRQNLYELVWSKPLSVLAREYQISDNGLEITGDFGVVVLYHNILTVLG